MFLLTGILAALLERHSSGEGQVIDAAMVDGVSVLAQPIWAKRAQGEWIDERGANFLDSGAPFYDTYQCSDGRYIAVAAIEPAFYALLLEGLCLMAADLPAQLDRDRWPELRAAIASAFSRRSRDDWAAIFSGVDACVTPVLTFEEAPGYSHLHQRGTLTEENGVVRAAPAPRFSRTIPDRGAFKSPVAVLVTDVLAGWARRESPT